jgi:ABC-2 type transport system permease protein
VLGGIMFIALVAFLVFFFYLRGGAYPEPLIRLYTVSFFPIVTLVFTVPLITMRAFSEDKQLGTLEVLLTGPVTDTSVVVGKFLAVWIFYMFCWSSFAIYPTILRIIWQESFDYYPLLSFLLGIGALGVGYVSIGIFISSLFRNQINALMCTLGVMMGFLFIYWITGNEAALSLFSSHFTIELLRYGSLVKNIEDVGQGLVNLKYLLPNVSMGVLFLFMTVKVLESRKWS